MERIIKFRGKNAATGLWEYGCYYIARLQDTTGHIIFKDTPSTVPSGNKDNAFEFRPEEVAVCIPETIGQFTGLKDIHGNEIYEGDIVRWDDCSRGKYWRFAVIEINPDIRFNCARVTAVNGIKNSHHGIIDYANFSYKKTEKYLEIVGNIFVNLTIKA